MYQFCRFFSHAGAELSRFLLFRQESMYYLTGYETFGFCFFQCLYFGADRRMWLLTRSADLRQAQLTSVIGDIRVWVDGTPEGDWVSMSVVSDGSYGVPEGLISSFPCVCKDGDYEIVQGLEVDAFSRERMDATDAELREERQAVADLL